MKTHVNYNEQIMREGRALRDRLAITGEHPEVRRKLDHLVDENFLPVALAQKLKNILELARVEPVKRAAK